MRTIAAVSVVALAATIGHMTTTNYIADIAIDHNYSYDDYVFLAKCTNKTPITEHVYMLTMTERLQLMLEGIA